MPIIAALLLLAETVLPAIGAWIAVLVVIVFASWQLGAYLRPSVVPRLQVCLGCAVLLTAAIVASPLLAGVGFLMFCGNERHLQLSTLALAGFGLHLLYWNHLSVLAFGFPARVAEAIEFLGPLGTVDPRTLVIDGVLVSVSSVATIQVLIFPIANLALAAAAPGSVVHSLLVLGAALAAAIAATVVVALWGHSHLLLDAWHLGGPLVLGAVLATCLGRARSWRPINCGRVLVVFLTALAVTWATAPTRGGAQRIAFDEGHGEWESSQGAFDSRTYGRDTVYNYALLKRWLSARHVTEILPPGWTVVDADVVVVKMPTIPFSADQKDAVMKLVERGGLLLVIGDHTNLYGSSSISNDLLAPFGLAIEPTATVPWKTDHYRFEPAWWQLNPWLSGTDFVDFQTAATIVSRTLFARPVITANFVSAENADYSNDRFFGEIHAGPEDQRPPLVLAAERRFGAGRVVVFGDSTIFSNFSLAAPGNMELFQNMIEFGSANVGPWQQLLVLLVWLLPLALTPRNPLCGFAGVVVAAAIASNLVAQRPPERYPARWIKFDTAHSSFTLRAEPWGAHGPALDDYSAFYAWASRIGAMPTASAAPYDDPRAGVVVLNPVKPFGQATLEEIEGYVRRGGRLLVLDDERFTLRSSSRDLLEHFGILVQETLRLDSLFEAGPPRVGDSLWLLPFDLLGGRRYSPRSPVTEGRPAITLAGGRPMFVTEDGLVIGTEIELGRGRVFAFLASSVFSEFTMGDVWGGKDVAPNRVAIYELAYRLLGAVAPRDELQ